MECIFKKVQYQSSYILLNFCYIIHFFFTQQELGQQLYSNENPNPQPFVAKIPKPTEGSFTRIHQPVFPHIDAQQVQSIIDEGTAKKVK